MGFLIGFAAYWVASLRSTGYAHATEAAAGGAEPALITRFFTPLAGFGVGVVEEGDSGVKLGFNGDADAKPEPPLTLESDIGDAMLEADPSEF